MNETAKRIIAFTLASFIAGVIIGDGIAWMMGMTSGSGGLVSSKFADELGEVGAIVAQTVLCGIMGVIGFMGSYVYHDERFGITTATLLHGAVTISAIMIISTVCWWNGRTIEGATIFFGMMVLVYAFVWFSMFFSSKVEVQRINELIQKRRGGSE
ncbi:MAG: DUF3021 domain-containing protein [Candidatus Methanomethylophilaceae archaeon]|nr:DUF3021 domain-containing protein [Candidatus Methanomethylophilaceae archaeon]